MPEGRPERRRLKIADLADENGIIRGRTFEDRLVTGPAVLVIVRPLGTIRDCEFPGPIESFVWTLPDGPVFGPVGLDGCNFIRCTFAPTVGFCVPPVIRAQFIEDLLR